MSSLFSVPILANFSIFTPQPEPYGEVSWGTVYLHLSPFSGFPHSATIWWVQLRYCMPSSVHHSLVLLIQQPYGEFSWGTVCLHLSQFSVFLIQQPYGEFSWDTVYLHLSQFSGFPHSAAIWWFQLRYCIPSSVTIIWFSSISNHMVSFSWGTVCLSSVTILCFPHSAAIWWVQLRYCIPSSVTVLWFSSLSSHMVRPVEVLYTFICHNSLVFLIQQPYGEFSWGTVYLHLSPFSGFPHSAAIWWVQLKYCIPSSVIILWFSSFSYHRWGQLRYCIPSSITILVFLIQQPYGEFSWGTVSLHLSQILWFSSFSSHMVSSAEVL